MPKAYYTNKNEKKTKDFLCIAHILESGNNFLNIQLKIKDQTMSMMDPKQTVVCIFRFWSRDHYIYYVVREEMPHTLNTHTPKTSENKLTSKLFGGLLAVGAGKPIKYLRR